jgi:ABC-type uncharacterized transport system permease subunit
VRAELPIAVVPTFLALALAITRAASPQLLIGGTADGAAAVGLTRFSWRRGLRRFTSVTS